MQEEPVKPLLELTKDDFESMWGSSAQKSLILKKNEQPQNWGKIENSSYDGEIYSLIAVYGDTGLMYFRARYYSGELGRFVSRDPLKYVDGMSMYRGFFAVNWVDPSGMNMGITPWSDPPPWGPGGGDDSGNSNNTGGSGTEGECCGDVMLGQGECCKDDVPSTWSYICVHVNTTHAQSSGPSYGHAWISTIDSSTLEQNTYGSYLSVVTAGRTKL